MPGTTEYQEGHTGDRFAWASDTNYYRTLGTHAELSGSPSWNELTRAMPEIGMRVERQPNLIFTPTGLKPTDNYSTVRSDGAIVSGVTSVGPRYRPFQTSELFEMTSTIVDGHTGCRIVGAGVIDQGRRNFIQVELPERINPTGSAREDVAMFATFLNSFDGSGSLRMVVGTVRLVCRNILPLMFGSRSIARGGALGLTRVHHTETGQRKLLVMAENFDRIIAAQGDYQKMVERLASSEVDQNRFARIVTNLYPIDDTMTDRQIRTRERHRDAFRATYWQTDDLVELTGTEWGMLQAAAQIDTHGEPGRDATPAQVSRRARQTVLGEGRSLAQRVNRELVLTAA